MDPEQYNTCVKLHADGLYRFMLKFTDGETARDIVQDCFEKLWIKKEGIQAEKGKSYLFTAAYHTMIDQKRKQKRLEIREELPQDTKGVYMQSPDLKEVLDKALETLPGIQKTVVLLRDYEGYSYEEIGEITGLKESQVKVYIFRARVSLKNYIGNIESVLG